jgi:hypothetical protein
MIAVLSVEPSLPRAPLVPAELVLRRDEAA